MMRCRTHRFMPVTPKASAPADLPTRSIRLTKKKCATSKAGSQSQWMNNRLILNGAFYYAFVDNYQFFFLDVSRGGQVISNIDEVDIYGVELEAQAVLTDYWSAYASIGHDQHRD